MPPEIIWQSMIQNTGKVSLRTAGWEASREWLWGCCQQGLGVCILPAHTSTTGRTPTTSAGLTRGNVGILNIPKPACWAPFPDSVLALSHLEAQGRNLPWASPAPERFSLRCGSSSPDCELCEGSEWGSAGNLLALIHPVFTPNTTKGTANIPTWCHGPLTAVGHWCGSPLGMTAVTTPSCRHRHPPVSWLPCQNTPALIPALLSGHWQNIKRQMDGKVPGWPDCSAGVSSRCQRDWTHIYSGLFQCSSWPWGQVLFTGTCLMLGNNLKQILRFF